MKRYVFLLLPALLALTLLLPSGAGAQARKVCFNEVPDCITGEFLNYWERNGGLAVFGYPISPEILNETVEGTWVGRTQWFQRDRLELHSVGVLAGRMGARLLELQGRSWWDFPPFVGENPAGCAYFAETRHSVCEPFLSYWKNNGGLERFGYPLSQPMTETVEGWTGTVQYFERRRMEHHTELAGTRYEVLLGLLGRDIFTMAPPQLCTTPIADELQASLTADPAAREALGCPTLTVHGAPAADQPYENGSMYWVDLGAGGKKIIRVWDSIYQPGTQLSFQIYDDTWTDKDPADYGLQPPPGRYAPLRGFGKLWVSNKFVRQDMGWGTAPERATRAVVQQFGSGAMLLWTEGSPSVLALGPRNSDVRIIPLR